MNSRAERERAAAAAVYADGDAVDRVMRVESHLTRQLGLTLDLLDRLRGEAGGAGRVGALLRALPLASVRSLPASAAVGSFRNGVRTETEPRECLPWCRYVAGAKAVRSTTRLIFRGARAGSSQRTERP